jgi:hypothetical protein
MKVCNKAVNNIYLIYIKGLFACKYFLENVFLIFFVFSTTYF